MAKINYKSLGEQLRDHGMDRVLANAGDDWKQKVRAVVCSLAMESPTITIVEVRERAAALGIEDPHHENAWGAVLNGCSGKYVKATGLSMNSPVPASHARKIQIWQSLLHDGSAAAVRELGGASEDAGSTASLNPPDEAVCKEARETLLKIRQFLFKRYGRGFPDSVNIFLKWAFVAAKE